MSSRIASSVQELAPAIIGREPLRKLIKSARTKLAAAIKALVDTVEGSDAECVRHPLFDPLQPLAEDALTLLLRTGK